MNVQRLYVCFFLLADDMNSVFFYVMFMCVTRIRQETFRNMWIKKADDFCELELIMSLKQSDEAAGRLSSDSDQTGLLPSLNLQAVI